MMKVYQVKAPRNHIVIGNRIIRNLDDVKNYLNIPANSTLSDINWHISFKLNSEIDFECSKLLKFWISLNYQGAV
jgi:hypothetical protein